MLVTWRERRLLDRIDALEKRLAQAVGDIEYLRLKAIEHGWAADSYPAVPADQDTHDSGRVKYGAGMMRY